MSPRRLLIYGLAVNTLCELGTETSAGSFTITRHPMSPRCAEQSRVASVLACPTADSSNWCDLPKFGDLECDRRTIESFAFACIPAVLLQDDHASLMRLEAETQSDRFKCNRGIRSRTLGSDDSNSQPSSE